MFAILSATLTMGNIDVNLSESGDATVAQSGPELKVVAVSTEYPTSSAAKSL